MEGHLPDDILYRQKMGFVTPISSWFKGPLAAEAADLATSSTLAETGWFDAATIAKAARDHKAGLADNGRLLWQLVMLEKSVKRLFG
jgi:asparagine synthase (glutamine-hydrolysing)